MAPGKLYSIFLLLSTVLMLQEALPAAAQEKTVNGTVRNTSGEALPAASVNLVDGQSVIVQFAITDRSGAYTLSIPAGYGTVPLWLEVSHIGYKKGRMAVDMRQAGYHFVLQADPDALQEVTVKQRPLATMAGDTLRYYVMGFAQKEDRSIRDVLRRMPGIDVADDGTIYYNGKKIENLYIHGDDLMDGRYGLATKVIRKEMIAHVDVIRNHQPIKVLHDKVLSDKTSINLVLKDENSLKLSAHAMAGAGLPEQYDASFSAILLNKRIKMINTLSGNNSGVDYRNDFRQLGAANLISNISQPPAQLALSMATIGPPDLPLPNYYFNRSGMINLNDLYTTSTGIQVKANMQGYIDRNSLGYYSRTDNYLDGDTVSYREQQTYVNRPWLLNGSLNVMINRSQYFFNNTLRAQFSGERNNSAMDFNDAAFGQKVKKRVQELSNDLNWIPALRGKGIGELRWLLSYNRHRQQLNIGQGYYASMGDPPGYYEQVIQEVTTPALFTHAYASYRLPGTHFNQEYKAGFTYERQRLGSLLSFEQNGLTLPYGRDEGNDLPWHKQQTYISTDYEIKYARFRSTIRLPLQYQAIRYAQPAYQSGERNGRLLFIPSVNMRYDLTAEQSLTANYSFSDQFGNITGVYKGAILQNYRSLQASHAGVQEKKVHAAAINYEFQRSIKLLFVNAGLSWSETTAQTLLSSDIADHLQTIVFLPYRNSQRNLTATAGFSKYVFGLKGTGTLKARWNRIQFVQLINEELLPFRSDALSLNGTWLKKVGEAVSITYLPNGLWSTTRLQNDMHSDNNFTHHAFRLDQQLILGVAAPKRLYIETMMRHSYTRQSNNQPVRYFFLDGKIRYSHTQKGIDLSLTITNLFDVKDYTLYTISSNQLVADQYFIRGRMALLRMDYYF